MALRRLRATRELFEDLARLEGQVAKADAFALAVFLVELHLPWVLLERSKHRDGRGITELRERLDGGCDCLGIGVLQEASEELHAARLADLGEEKRELGKRRAPFGEAVDGALDPECDLLEAIESQAFQGLAGMDARFGRIASHDIDEQVDDLRTIEIAKQNGDAREAKRRLVLVAVLQRGGGRVAKLGHDLFAILVEETGVEPARGALGIEERGQIFFDRRHGRGHEYHEFEECFATPGSLRFVKRSLWAGAAALTCLAFGAGRPLGPIRSAAARGAAGPSDAGSLADRTALGRSECPPGTAPDHDACVHLVRGAEDAPLAPSLPHAHRNKSGRWAQYEQIPRLPDRPSDYDAYRYPIPPGLPNGHYVVSGYDLDRPDPEQRRAHALSHVGHGGVDLPQAKGTPVKLVALDHQEGEAEVLFTGSLFGTTVVTRQTLREGGRVRDYVVLFGHLASIAAGLAPGAMLKEGDLVGAVGDTASPSLVHLHYEVRRVREGVELAKVPAGAQLIADSVSVVCDPRNVLPLK